LAGLKHWRYDLRSGFMVAMISLPFSMGIAITSGASPVCGIVSAIIAGLVLPFLGGSYVTISGPAAGLAPALFAGMIMLGGAMLGREAKQDELLRVGYPLVLVAICLAGLVQLVLARMKVARLSSIFPAAAIEGMLASIGLLIIVKQIPLFMGVKFEAHEFWEILEEVPHHFSSVSWNVFVLGMVSLAVLFALAAIPSRFLKVMPPPVWVFFLGTLVSQFFLHLDKPYLIDVPEAPLKHRVVLPNFADAFGHSALWLPLAYLVFLLVLIDGTESLTTILAVDKIDPYRRRSDPDRTLQAMGVSNVASSMLGGLTIIPGIVKSTANIMGGGRTQWANFYNACFLLVFLVFGRDLINMVPKTILAAILVFVGFKLCRPKVWRHVASIGSEQLLIFTITVLVTLSTDLLVGIAVGIAAKFVLSAVLTFSVTRRSPAGGYPRQALRCLMDLFRDPVTHREAQGNVYRLSFGRPLSCFNLLHVYRAFAGIPAEAREVHLELGDGVTLIDHTSCTQLLNFAHEYEQNGKGKVEIHGLDRLRMRSDYESCMRVCPQASLPSDEVGVVDIHPFVARPDQSIRLVELSLVAVEEDARTPHDDLEYLSLSDLREDRPSDRRDRTWLA
jgi:MFS superfamily sulfate permease-like transporter